MKSSRSSYEPLPPSWAFQADTTGFFSFFALSPWLRLLPFEMDFPLKGLLTFDGDFIFFGVSPNTPSGNTCKRANRLQNHDRQHSHSGGRGVEASVELLLSSLSRWNIDRNSLCTCTTVFIRLLRSFPTTSQPSTSSSTRNITKLNGSMSSTT